VIDTSNGSKNGIALGSQFSVVFIFDQRDL
jgi:hypothetical protein